MHTARSMASLKASFKKHVRESAYNIFTFPIWVLSRTSVRILRSQIDYDMLFDQYEKTTLKKQLGSFTSGSQINRNRQSRCTHLLRKKTLPNATVHALLNICFYSLMQIIRLNCCKMIVRLVNKTSVTAHTRLPLPVRGRGERSKILTICL